MQSQFARLEPRTFEANRSKGEPKPGNFKDCLDRQFVHAHITKQSSRLARTPAADFHRDGAD